MKITTAQIVALRSESAEHGDLAMVAVCDRALDGSRRALTIVRRVIADAAAQQ